MNILLLLLVVAVTSEVINEDASKYRMPSRKVFDLPLDPKDRATYPINTMPMKLDHFNLYNPATFSMRYAKNNLYYNPSVGGPLFIFVGGEAPLESDLGYLSAGLMVDIGKTVGASLMMTEHRFYGQSIPNMDLSLSNMEYLTVPQAMADLADFIKNIKRGDPKLTKVVLVGGSYPGSLAAWMRLKYPDVVDASVSASGLATIKINNIEYNEVVQKVIGNYNTICLNTIKNGMASTVSFLQQGRILKVANDYGWSPLSLVTSSGQKRFLKYITVVIGGVVQYDKQDPKVSVASMCSGLTQYSYLSSDYTRFARVVKNIISIDYSGTVTQDEKNAEYSWGYQLCSNLGNFVTTDSRNQPYGQIVPLSDWYTFCINYYSYTSNAVNSGNNYLKDYTKDEKNATKVVYTIGSNDPWSPVGMTTSPNSLAPVLTIPGSSHCAILMPSNQVNSAALADARSKVTSYITSWIK